MTDDEAFIRAVVDGPGDDTPRLVYADWLDDRADPRGTYLRAEADALRRFREAGDLKTLLTWHASHPELAAGLDPVWVARVSRPPVGVCCDHMRLTDCGPVLTAEEIGEVEQRLGGSFPADFRAFLLNHNGGVPNPADCPYPASVGWDDMDLEIGSFYSARRRVDVAAEFAGAHRDCEIEDERDFLHSLFRDGGGEGNNPLIEDVVPFAHTIHDLGYFLLGTGVQNNGRVYHFRDYCHSSNDPDHFAEYTQTFADFLTLIRPEREK
jgi:uncharacterized protein (TIGR02996 family)